ncbi:MAG: hypothetical protein QM706_15950 [Nitrospira sp.]
MEVGTDSSGQAVADKGERIYQDLYQHDYESKFGGQYAVINVVTTRAYVADTAADAIINAKVDDPEGLFHLIKIQGSAPKGMSFLRKLLDYVRRLGDIKLP